MTIPQSMTAQQLMTEVKRLASMLPNAHDTVSLVAGSYVIASGPTMIVAEECMNAATSPELFAAAEAHIAMMVGKIAAADREYASWAEAA